MKLIITFLLSITILHSNVFGGLDKVEPNGNVSVVIDLSSSYEKNRRLAKRRVYQILNLSTGKLYDDSKPPKFFSLLTTDVDNLVVQKAVNSNMEASSLQSIIQKTFTEKGGSDVLNSFRLAKELAQKSNRDTLLVAFTDLEQGNVNDGFKMLLGTLKGFKRVIIVGVDQIRREYWKKELEKNGITHVALLTHGKKLCQLSKKQLKTCFQSQINKAKSRLGASLPPEFPYRKG